MSYLAPFLRYSETSVENRQLEPTPPRPLGGDSVGISPIFWHQKTRVPGLSYGVVCMILRLVVLVQCQHMSDKRTDRHSTTAYIALA